MRNLLSKYIEFKKDTSGMIITIFLLFLIPLSLFLIISQTEIANISRVADKTVNYAVTNAVKSAAMMVDPESQAQGEPRIAHKKAYDEFVNNIKYSLYINEMNETTNKSSIDGKIKYWLLVYNGDSIYKGYTEEDEVKEMVLYQGEIGIRSEPQEFHILNSENIVYVNESGINEIEKGKKVKLIKPGVLAVIQVEGKPVVLNKKETITRWAYGKIVKK